VSERVTRAFFRLSAFDDAGINFNETIIDEARQPLSAQ
jgi:hypothetical protein